MDDVDTTQKQSNTILTIVAATLTGVIFCLFCTCAYRSFIAWLNEENLDWDSEASSWTTELRTQNRKIKRQKSRRQKNWSI